MKMIKSCCFCTLNQVKLQNAKEGKVSVSQDTEIDFEELIFYISKTSNITNTNPYPGLN